MGRTSNSRAHRVANVWKRKLPAPIQQISTSRRRVPRESALSFFTCRQPNQAAIRKQMFVKALTGSAQKSGEVLSQ